jgi:hypothetical protein
MPPRTLKGHYRPQIDIGKIGRMHASPRKRNDLWTAIRRLRRFTAHDLMAVCERDDRKGVMSYVNLLKRAGYVRVVDRGSQAHHIPQTYLIVRDTGPKQPASLAKRRTLLDMNTREEFPLV